MNSDNLENLIASVLKKVLAARNPAGRSVAIGSDHGGFDLKEQLKNYISSHNYDVKDVGTFSKESCDYPDYAAAVARSVQSGECEFGIMIDGAGIGSSMVCNKFSGVRAALCYDLKTILNSRQHNNANVLTLGAKSATVPELQEYVKTWLETPFEGGRHENRVSKIENPARASGSGEDFLRQTRSDVVRATQLTYSVNEEPEQGATPYASKKTAYASVSVENGNMDIKKLVELVTQEVLKALKTDEYKSAGTGQTGSSFRGYQSHNPSILGREFSQKSENETPPYDHEIAAIIDHTLLKSDATEEEIDKLCAEARKFKFCSVCVNTHWVSRCRDNLRGSGVKVCTVVGFPLGAMDSKAKAFETREAIASGADEIDMVINIGELKSRALDAVEKDIRSVVQAAHGKTTKVILETGLLNDEEKVLGCEIAKKAGATFVKTSTGFSKGGATAEDIALMRKTVGPRMGVKASGGVRTIDDAKKMIAAGATRIGASSSVAIVTGGTGKGY